MKTIFSIFIFLVSTHQSFGSDYTELAIEKRNITEYDSSVYYFNVALQTGNLSDTSKANILIERGKTHQLAQLYDLALLDFNSGFEIFKKVRNFNGIALSRIYTAELYRHLGKLETAETTIREVELIHKNNNFPPKTKALFHNRLAAILAETGTEGEDGVITNSNKAIEIASNNNFKEIEASSLNQLGYLFFNHKDNKCIEYYIRALNIYEDVNDLRSQINVIKNLARHYQIAGKYDKCINYCEKGINLIGSNDWYFDLKDLYHLKMVSYYFKDMYLEAYLTSVTYNKTYIDYMNTQHNKNFLELETKYNVEQKDNQILLEQEKSKISKQETEQKQKELQYYILISALLAIILLIALYFSYKIKRTNNLLNQSLEQKEILLQEVHHRVKNNLTVLNSLLYIQADESSNKDTKRVLSECQSRIQSMAIVHQNLYDVDDASVVKLDDFIKQLINESQDIFGSPKNIKTKINTAQITFDMSFTVFLGLIINELLTNSLKYAFNNEYSNQIEINLIQQDNNYTLTYTDSGKGLPIDFSLKESGGFGFKLINIMINQIHGKLDYDQKNNIFTIHFRNRKRFEDINCRR